MKQFIRALAVLSVAAGLAPAGLAAQQQERSNVPEKYRWNLAEIYPDDQAWRAAKDAWPDLIVGLGVAILNADAAREVYLAAKIERASV